METKSLYSEVAIDLLLGQVNRSQPQTQTACYGRTSARAERNDHSALGVTNAGGDKPCPRPVASSSESCQKTEKNPQQNTCEKSCTDLAANYRFTGVSKDLFRRQQATIFACSPAGILTLPEQESEAVDIKSAHRRLFKMQSRQEIQFFYRPGPAEELLSAKTRGYIRLTKLTKFMTNQTTTQRAYG